MFLFTFFIYVSRSFPTFQIKVQTLITVNQFIIWKVITVKFNNSLSFGIHHCTITCFIPWYFVIIFIFLWSPCQPCLENVIYIYKILFIYMFSELLFQEIPQNATGRISVLLHIWWEMIQHDNMIGFRCGQGAPQRPLTRGPKTFFDHQEICRSLSEPTKWEKPLGGTTELLCHTWGQLWYQSKVLMSFNLRATFGESVNILKSSKQCWCHHSIIQDGWLAVWANKLLKN